MKTYLNIIITVILTGVISFNTNAQDNKKTETAEFKVTGVCGMCKERIENAALIKGVKLAEWDASTQMIKVVYQSNKVTQDEIEKSIAGAGHDTEHHVATEDGYKKLPACCAYKDGVEVH